MKNVLSDEELGTLRGAVLNLADCSICLAHGVRSNNYCHHWRDSEKMELLVTCLACGHVLTFDPGGAAPYPRPGEE